MNFLSLFVLVPLLTMGALLFSKTRKQLLGSVLTGFSLQLLLAMGLTLLYIAERSAGNGQAFSFFRASSMISGYLPIMKS